MHFVVPALLSLALLAVPGRAQSPSNRRDVTEKEFGEKWPLTVDKGAVACYPGPAVVFIHGTDVYALNGTAKSQKKYRDINPIWKTNPKIPGTKINIGPLIDEGLKVCK